MAKFAAVAKRGKSLEVQFFGEFESIFETALDHESEYQLGTMAKSL